MTEKIKLNPLFSGYQMMDIDLSGSRAECVYIWKKKGEGAKAYREMKIHVGVLRMEEGERRSKIKAFSSIGVDLVYNDK